MGEYNDKYLEIRQYLNDVKSGSVSEDRTTEIFNKVGIYEIMTNFMSKFGRIVDIVERILGSKHF